jgi:ketosteroid isomerase-like protein
MRYLTNFRKIAAFAIILSFEGCAVAPDRLRAQRATSRAGHEIQERLAEIFDAAEKKDFRRLDSYHLYGSHFSKFSGPTFIRQDANAAQSGEHTGLSAISELRMHAADLKIDVFAGTGVATFLLEYRFRAGATRFDKQERATLVFVKQGGEWLIVHEHLSIPVPPPGNR